jgi:hypothetical protein
MKSVGLRCLFQLAVLVKGQGKKVYVGFAEKASNIRTKSLYSRLAEAEEAHKRIFENSLSAWGHLSPDVGLLDTLCRELDEKGLFKSPPPSDAKEEEVIKYAIEQQGKIVSFFLSFEGSFPEAWKREQIQKLVKIEKSWATRNIFS